MARAYTLEELDRLREMACEQLYAEGCIQSGGYGQASDAMTNLIYMQRNAVTRAMIEDRVRTMMVASIEPAAVPPDTGEKS